jgi:hypothetical protein
VIDDAANEYRQDDTGDDDRLQSRELKGRSEMQQSADLLSGQGGFNSNRGGWVVSGERWLVLSRGKCW